MKDTNTQWHPGFIGAMDLEFREDRGRLSFEKEHNLNTKPLQIDLLVMRHLEDKLDRESADSVLEVCLRENRELIEKLMGDDSMSEALLEIMEPKIIEIRRQAKTEGLEQGLEQGIRYLVESLRGVKISENEIKEEIMKKYHLSEEDAAMYL